MNVIRTACGLAVAFTLVLQGCASASTPGNESSQRSAGEPPAVRKRLTAGLPSVPPNLNTMIAGAVGRFEGMEAVTAMVNAGLGMSDNEGTVRPQLAETVPTVENGLWKIFPDGKMEMTWKLRPGAVWHDGVPFTTADLVFTQRLQEDRELALFSHPSFKGLESAEAVDPLTLVTRWSAPNIGAVTAFGFEGFRSHVPLPAHLLERSYVADKASFIDLPYFTTEFIGTGPYRLKEWASGSYVLLEAFDQYILGRPKIDEIEVRFIPDGSTMAANLLAGSVEVTLGRALSFEQASELLNKVPGSKADMAPAGALTAYPQFLNPNPPIVSRLDFRRALLHAVDRQELVDTIMGGRSAVAHAVVRPSDQIFGDIEPSVVKYEFDPRRSAQLIEGLGYQRGPDGGWQSAAGERLITELRVSRGGPAEKTTIALADAWKRVGLGVDLLIIPEQLEGDTEYKANYPAFEMVGRSINLTDLSRVLHSTEAPLLENRYRGGNRGRYVNADLDVMLDRYALTIAAQDRLQLLQQVVRHMTENVVFMGVIWDIDATFSTSRLSNITGKYERSIQTWNVHEWDVR
ncbi:MAG: hypothetical protein HW416_3084 [Chloroflexi bacterium]|nr:hypothetical protein [Chloroflexota bacterium]